MLKQPPPSHLRAALGLLAGIVVGTTVTGVVYAASRPAVQGPAPQSTTVGAGEYQLDLMVALFSKGTKANHAERTTAGLCMKPGEPGSVNLDKGWNLAAKVMPLDGGRVSVALDLSTAPGKSLPTRRLEGRLGQPLLAEFKDADGVHAYSIDVTPLAGCPARQSDSGAAARLTMITQAFKKQPVRDVVESMAKRAGLEVTNPEALTMRPVTLNFEQIPAERALRLLADIDGKQAIFQGKRVRFDAK